MRIVAWANLADFMRIHPEVRVPLVRWRDVVKGATWRSMDDVRAAFSNAVVLNGERVRFEIAGGNYRLIVAFKFGSQIAFVKFIGTHKEYDKIDALEVVQF
ncbi:MAG TPA: type II toxin-antitoxin system HigB family toxin [Xanthobacteraceae bacterium]|jgi:mRNA interferase HigB